MRLAVILILGVLGIVLVVVLDLQSSVREIQQQLGLRP